MMTQSGRYRIHVLHDAVARFYLIESEDALFLVDTGMPGNARQVVERIAGFPGKPLRLVFVTHAHFDHYGSAAPIRTETGAPIAVHRKDAVSMQRGETPLRKVRNLGRLGRPLWPLVDALWPTPEADPDLLVDNGSRFDEVGLDARVVHLPGHTPGSSCLLLEKVYAFVGDLIIARPWIHGQRYFADDWDDVATSLERLKLLGPEMVFPGHGRPFSGARLRGLEV